MGTSSSYKGSSSSAWRIARERFAEIDNQTDETNNPEQDASNNAASALADALIQDNPKANSSPQNYHLPSLVASSSRSNGGGGGVGGANGGSARSRKGRGGSRSTREVQKGAARAATAIRAAYGLRSADPSSLDGLNLDFNELRDMTPKQQCMKIVDAVIGDANHPDDLALKRATLEHLKNILLAETPPTIEDTIRDFVAEWIFQLGLVELKAEIGNLDLTADQLKQREDKLQRWLRVRVKQLSFPDAQRLSARQFSNATAKLTAESLKLIKAMQR